MKKNDIYSMPVLTASIEDFEDKYNLDCLTDEQKERLMLRLKESVKNHESIMECYRMIIEYIAEDMGLEELRVCSYCGRTMKEGYYLGGEYACSDECRNELYRKDGMTDEECEAAYLKDYEYSPDECYYTEWY